MPVHFKAFVRNFGARTRPDASGCVIWTGGKGRGLYGRVQMDKRRTSAHWAAWIIAHGPIPDGLHVLHRCDNPPCVNPDHLFLGTNADNRADCEAKGRHLRKLTLDECAAIKRLSKTGILQRELAERYGVGQQTISRVLHGRRRSPA